jgi:hypothetical protein
MVEQMPNRQMAQLFDELIEAHELLGRAERLIEEYVAQNVLPETPETFENVEALARYNAEKARYELGLSGVMERRADRLADYERAARRVEPLLPEGARLTHAYGGTHAAVAGGQRYVVFKERELTGIPEGGISLETAAGEVSSVSYVIRVERVDSGSA